MIRLMGLVELRPVGSLKKEVIQQEEVELSDANETIEEDANAPSSADQAKIAAKKSWSDANKQIKNISDPEQKRAAREKALGEKQRYLDAQKRAMQSKNSTVKEVNTSIRNIVDQINETPGNVVDNDTPPVDTNDDGEGYMAKAQLMSLNKQSGELYNMLSDNEELEAWIQSKITKASDYINAAYNYLQYEKNKANTIGNGEGVPADPSMPTDDNLNEGVRLRKRT